MYYVKIGWIWLFPFKPIRWFWTTKTKLMVVQIVPFLGYLFHLIYIFRSTSNTKSRTRSIDVKAQDIYQQCWNKNQNRSWNHNKLWNNQGSQTDHIRQEWSDQSSVGYQRVTRKQRRDWDRRLPYSNVQNVPQVLLFWTELKDKLTLKTLV